MSFEFIKKLPTPDEIRSQFPVPPDLAKRKEERDAQIRDVLTGKSNKFLVIIEPVPQITKTLSAIMLPALPKSMRK